ncbi:MAG TPA: hypothetical protein VIG48_10365 [Jatrophihabitans sp.]|jgi:hypothetical protein
MSTDILDTVAGFAPTRSFDWTPARQDAVLAAIVGGVDSGASAPAVEIPLQFRPRPTRTRRRATTLAATAAAFTAAASAIIAITLPGGSSPAPTVTAGAPFVPPPGLSGHALPRGKFLELITKEMSVGKDGRSDGAQSGQFATYFSADGHVLRFVGRVGSACGYHLVRRPSIEDPTAAFFAGLPTDVSALNRYLRSHVQGSSSLDEAVFVAVGDALRTADGLASPKLRAAMLAVLSRTPGVILHEGSRDHLDRPAIRADFVNQAIRPGDVQSLYFDPTTFALLAQSEGPNGAPTGYDGPSPAYRAPAPGAAVDPDRLPAGPGYVTVIAREHVVDSLPNHDSCS